MRQRRQATSRSAMTLIELLVTAVLASMMLTALMGIVWSASRETVMLRRGAAGRFPVTQLSQRMRTDFVNARGMQSDPRGVTLRGFLGSDRSNDRAMLTPAQVRYEIRVLSNRPTLFRIASAQSEPVWHGCQTLQIDALDIVDREDAAQALAESGGLPAMPQRLRVTLIGDEGQLLWREVIHHHDD